MCLTRCRWSSFSHVSNLHRFCRFHIKQSRVQSLCGKIAVTVYELNFRFLVIHFRLAVKRAVRKVEAKFE